MANESGDDAERAELSGTSAVGALVVVVVVDALDALVVAVALLRWERGFASQMQRVCRPVLKRFSRHAWHCDRGRPRRLTTSRGPLDPSWCLHVDARWPWMQVAHASFTGGSVGGGARDWAVCGMARGENDTAGPRAARFDGKWYLPKWAGGGGRTPAFTGGAGWSTMARAGIRRRGGRGAAQPPYFHVTST